MNSLRTAFQLMGIGADGEAVDPVSDEQVERIVGEKIAERDVSGQPSRSVESVQDAILVEFQEETVDRIMDRVEQLSDRQRKLLQYIEACGSTVSPKKEWVQQALGWESTNSDVLDEMRELENAGFVRKNKDSSIAPNVRQVVEEEPAGYDAEEETVAETQQRVLAEMRENPT